MWSNFFPDQNVTVGFAEFLWRCERNETVFEVLGVKISNSKVMSNWSDAESLFSGLAFDGNVKVLNTELQEQLEELSLVLSVNMTQHRVALAKPITGRDLKSFLDQLNTVARKLSDRESVKRVEDLVYRIKNVIEETIKPLIELRDELVYNITSLEILVIPLKRELNQTMSHLKTIQFFFDNQGATIAAKVMIIAFWEGKSV